MTREILGKNLYKLGVCWYIKDGWYDEVVCGGCIDGHVVYSGCDGGWW